MREFFLTHFYFLNTINQNHKEVKNMADCTPFDKTITVTKLAQAYVPIQKLCTLMEPTQALLAGTVFPELVDIYK